MGKILEFTKTSKSKKKFGVRNPEAALIFRISKESEEAGVVTLDESYGDLKTICLDSAQLRVLA